MRIDSLRLKPFAGIIERKVDFSSGLNIIFGPNEAGKSTLLNALEAVLFIPVSLTKSKHEKLIKNYLPANGGNVIRVYLDFQVAGKVFRLEKEWKETGKGGVCIFKSNGGSEYAGDEKVSELIKQYLPAEEGTIRNVLLTWQSSLDRTKDIFDGNGRNVRSDLGNILRSSIMETDGISIDQLKGKLELEYKQYFNHWDPEREEPENRRGINNPYTKEVGIILKAYYDKEKKKRDYELASQIEEELDRLNDEIRAIEEKNTKIQTELEKYEPLRSKIITRQQIESDLISISNQVENIMITSDDWAIQENWLSNNANSEIKKLEERIKKLQEDRDEVRTYIKNKALRKRFEKLKKLSDNLKKANEQLSQISPINREDINSLQEKNQQIKEVEKVIAASKLRLSFNAKIPYDFITKDANGQKEEHSIKKNQSFVKIFQGKLSIEHQDWSLEVQAGEGEIDSLIDQKEKIAKEFSEELDKLGVTSLTEAQSENKKYEQYQTEVNFARKAYQEELGDDDYKELENQIESPGEEKRPQSLDTDEIASNIANAIRDLKEVESKKEEYEKNIKQWQEEYGTKKKLMVKIGEKQFQLEKAQERLKDLPELPVEFADYKGFFDYLDSLNVEKEQYREDIYDLREKKNEKGQEKPDFSSEELLTIVHEAEQNYQRVCLEGEAIALIISKTNEILESIGKNPYKDFQSRFKDYFLNMCDNSFAEIEMADDYPNKLIKPDGSELSYDLLSFGTKDTFSLALRLTMAEYFLKDKEGFLILDDPLVDMDLERQKLSARQINEFAKTKQVIFLTCHEHTARLLQGKCIKL